MTATRARKNAFAGLNRRLAAMSRKGKSITIRFDVFDVLSVFAGGVDPRFVNGAMQYMRQTYQTAMNKTDDRLTCFCCCRE